MAILDSKLEFSDAQHVGNASAVGWSVGSSNVIDLSTGYDEWGNTKYNDLGEAGDLWLNVVVSTSFTPTGGSFKVHLQTASSAATAIASSGATNLATYTKTWTNFHDVEAGKSIVRAKLPAGSYARYLGLLYEDAMTGGASIMTAGNVNAWIGADSETAAPSA